MIHRIRDGCSDPSDADFSYAATAHGIEVEVGFTDPGDIDLGHIGVHWYQVAREIRVDRVAASSGPESSTPVGMATFSFISSGTV